MVSIPLGTLNALVNTAVWVMNGICFSLSSQVYQCLSGYLLSNTGKTEATDSSEVVPLAWIFGHFWTRKRLPAGWVLALLLMNLVLFPLEILLEAGAYQHKRCTPRSEKSIGGVCASKWMGQSPLGITAAALSTQRTHWGDKSWDAVVEGSSKIPDPAEVHFYNCSKRRRYVIHNCKVETSGCPSGGCGNLLIKVCDELSHDVVKDWSHRPKNTKSPNMNCTNDVSWDNGLTYLFWGTRLELDPEHAMFNGSRINVRGFEALLTESQIQKVRSTVRKPQWSLDLASNQTRTYNITCATDGIHADDLALGVSLYRTAQMENSQMNVIKSSGEGITKVTELTYSDITKAAYSVKAEDVNDSCTGYVDKYRSCGAFKLSFLIPFFALSTMVMGSWIILCLVLRKSSIVPVTAASWKEAALGALSTKSSGKDDLHDAELIELSGGFDFRRMDGIRSKDVEGNGVESDYKRSFSGTSYSTDIV